jgi:hypothetical protein
VITLWVLAVLAARTEVSLGLVALAAVWGLIVPILGIMHMAPALNALLRRRTNRAAS